jgi:AraC-like DNA-binding protein
MNGGSGKHEELFALRRALWEVAERAQRAIAQFDMYVKTHRESSSDTSSRSGTAEELPAAEDDAAPQQAPPLLHDVLTTGAGVRAALRPDHSPEVGRALRHIELHFERPIDLDQLTRIAGCSRSTLTRAFRREVGQTAHAYLVGIRLARAAYAMASGDKIEVVMLMAGFRSKRNFYRLFKAQFGVTPSQFSQTQANQGVPEAPGTTVTVTGSA